MSKIFVSYSKSSDSQIDGIIKDLESLGHAVWIDRQLTGGQVWWDRILKEIRDNDVFLPFVTTESLKSLACTREREYAAKLKKIILPVLDSENVTYKHLPRDLANIHSVEYSDSREYMRDLAKALSTMRSASPMPNPLPPEPEPPLSPIIVLESAIDPASELKPDDQKKIIFDLKQLLKDPSTSQRSVELLKKLRRHPAIIADIRDEIDDLVTEHKNHLRVETDTEYLHNSDAVHTLNAKNEPLKTQQENPTEIKNDSVSDNVAIVGGILGVIVFFGILLTTESSQFDLAMGLNNIERMRSSGNLAIPKFVMIDVNETEGLPKLEPISSSNRDSGNSDEIIADNKKLEEDFIITETEITFSQFDKHLTAIKSGYSPSDNGWGRETRPVVNVTVDEARKYARWLSFELSKYFGEFSHNDLYCDLPSDLEWNFAASAKSDSAFHWGDAENQAKKYAWYSTEPDKTESQTLFSHPVATKLPNKFGLYDTAGNVWEWVYSNVDLTDGLPVNECTDGIQMHTAKGGSFNSNVKNLGVNGTQVHQPDFKSPEIGFRIVCRLGKSNISGTSCPRYFDEELYLY